MSLDAIVFWGFVAAWIVVGALFVFVQLPRIVREARRIIVRVTAFANDSTVSFAIAKAEGDSNRLNAALDELPALQLRALAAVEAIRATPVVPPAIGELVARVKREIRDFRREAS